MLLMTVQVSIPCTFCVNLKLSMCVFVVVYHIMPYDTKLILYDILQHIWCTHHGLFKVDSW